MTSAPTCPCCTAPAKTPKVAPSTTTSCQVCGRAILAKRGWIALHGYRRPGQGWQTASCYGARFRPFEVACDALPPALEGVRGYLAGTTRTRALLLSDPPAKLDVPARTGRRGYVIEEAYSVERPEGFDPAKTPSGYRFKSYELAFCNRAFELKRAIEGATDEVAFLEARIASWRAAHPEVPADVFVVEAVAAEVAR